MIDVKEIFNNDEVAKLVSFWLPDNGDGMDLAGAVEYAAEMKIPMLSVAPKDVPVVWPWVETLKMKVIPRFYIKNTVNVETMSDLAVNINSVFKQGAAGAQMILGLDAFDGFVNSLGLVRDDLFFNKDLSVGFDISEIWPLDWERVFFGLKKLHASSVLLVLENDTREKSDFTGRIYAALENWDADKDMELHVMLGNSFMRAEQVYRLVSINRPELLKKLKFFVNY